MRIYVVERFCRGGLIQLGWSLKREIAEAKVKEYEELGIVCWVEEYKLGASGYCGFND